jgi:hypothetical protein
MPCPDELTLDLWMAHALPLAEAEAVSAHVAACATCSAMQEQWQSLGASLHVALDLDQDERAFLTSLDLSAGWRNRTSKTLAAHWGWLAVVSVVTAFIAWTLTIQPFGDLLATADQVGLSTFLLTNVVGLLLGIAQFLIDISTNPALSLSQPLLAVLALTVLFWPRIKSAPQYLQGVRS